MGVNNKHGFTIIETLLFLGVSSMLAVGILAGSGYAITQQRYRDSVNSLRSSLQTQFTEVSNVRNDRSADWKCEANASVTPGGGGSARGTSECVILGRLISSYGEGEEAPGEALHAYTVIGRAKQPLETPPATDAEAFANYHISAASINNEVEPLEWGAVMRVPDVTDPALFSVLILRSPLTGGLRTYIPPPGGISTNLAGLITPENAARSLKICVDAPGSIIPGGSQAVIINGNAGNQSAVETRAEGSGC